jgi:hypothetical protein
MQQKCHINKNIWIRKNAAVPAAARIASGNAEAGVSKLICSRFGNAKGRLAAARFAVEGYPPPSDIAIGTSTNKVQSHSGQGVGLRQHGHGRLRENLVAHELRHFRGHIDI